MASLLGTTDTDLTRSAAKHKSIKNWLLRGSFESLEGRRLGRMMNMSYLAPRKHAGPEISNVGF